MNDFLTGLGAFAIMYAVGAFAIQWVCAGFLAHIPLLDQYAFTIRNILCGVWFIVLVVISIGMAISSK